MRAAYDIEEANVKDRTRGESRMLLSALRKSRNKNLLVEQVIAELANDLDLTKEIASWGEAMRRTHYLACGKGGTRGTSVEGQILLASNPIGSVLKEYPVHRAATFIGEKATVDAHFALAGGNGVLGTKESISL